MEEKYDLPVKVIEELKSEIRKHDKYKALEELRKKLNKQGFFAQAAKVKKDIEVFESKALRDCVAHYKKNSMDMSKAIADMESEDRQQMCVHSYASIMLIDALDTIIREMKAKFNSYYPTYKFNSYDELNQVVKKAKDFIAIVNNIGDGDPYHINLYGDSVDNVTELVVNKARSFMNKVNYHEKSVGNKSKCNAKVA